ncbi:hypothetical protein [Lichenicoccus sp.]|uniref:hypothetical protein n=1 Tax=Lichenicoccus sp. TaxID=2781899 RepID=UPI003D124CC5
MLDDGVEIVADDEHLWRLTGALGHRLVTTRQIRLMLQNGADADCRIEACRALMLEEHPGPTRLQPDGLAGSIRQRRWLLDELLAGAPGDPRRCGLIPAGNPAAEQIVSLLRSLGHCPGLVAGPAGMLIRWQVEGRGARRVVSVDPVASVPVRCLQVNSPSSLYLCTEGLVPTHNTFLMTEEIRRAVRLAVRHSIGTENEIWYAAPTFLQAKRVMWARLKKTIPRRWLHAPPNETDCSMRLRSGHVIRLVGLDAFENLRGSGLWFFGGDEWADCRPEAWNEVIRPMLSTARGHALFVGTPKGFDHFRDAYMLGQGAGGSGYRSFMFTTLSGGNVPSEEVEAARQQLDPRTFRQEYEASFETYAGRVIYAFSRAENVKAVQYDANRPLHVGMDFNINPMSASVWQEDGDIACQIDEIVMPTSNTDELAAELARRYGRPGFDPQKPALDHITIYPDPAGAQRRSSAAGRTDIGILRHAGFRVMATASHPSVRDRTNVVNRQFLSADGARHAFVDPGCVRSIEAYERLIYRDGTNEPDKSSGHDHLVDATGYYLFGRTLRQPVTARPVLQFMER